MIPVDPSHGGLAQKLGLSRDKCRGSSCYHFAEMKGGRKGKEWGGNWRDVDVVQPVLDFMQGLAVSPRLIGVTQCEALAAEFALVWGEGMGKALARPLKARKPMLVVGPVGSGRRHHVQALLYDRLEEGGIGRC